MAIPFPIGLIASVPDTALLTRIEFVVDISHQPNYGGLEDETDADGGVNVMDADFSSYLPGAGRTAVIDLTSLNILWSDRYNYRLGFGSVYAIANIKLFKDGIQTENQIGLIFSESTNLRHIGTNLDPGNRNKTTSLLGSPVAYPKVGKMTQVDFLASIPQYGIGAGGFEDETDADGGANLQNMSFSATTAGFDRDVTINLSADNINWPDRYNYRLGFADIYTVSNIELYRAGTIVETQAGSIVSVATKFRHIGVNIDPTFRNQTTIDTGSHVNYPK